MSARLAGLGLQPAAAEAEHREGSQMPGTTATRILGVAPCLLVEDVKNAAEWYRDHLGFGFARLWGHPPSFAMVKRDGIVIMRDQQI